MAKKLFVNKKLSIRKKRSFSIMSDLSERLNAIEIRAEKAGVAFPLDEHVEVAIARLVRDAEAQLEDLESASKSSSSALISGRSSNASF